MLILDGGGPWTDLHVARDRDNDQSQYDHDQQRGGASSSRVATTKRTTTLSRREQVAFFFGRFKKLGKDIVRNLIPKMVIGSAKAAACTYLLRSALGERRISWFTSSAICFMFMY